MGNGRLLETWRLLQGRRRHTSKAIQFTPMYLTLEFGSHVLFLHLHFPSSKWRRSGGSYNVGKAMMHPFILCSVALLVRLPLTVYISFITYYMQSLIRSLLKACLSAENVISGLARPSCPRMGLDWILIFVQL